MLLVARLGVFCIARTSGVTAAGRRIAGCTAATKRGCGRSNITDSM
jgi:hypothetical protein